MKGGEFKRAYLTPRTRAENVKLAKRWHKALAKDDGQKMTLDECIDAFMQEDARNQTLLIVRNQIYTVYVDEQTNLAHNQFAGKVTHLSIKRNDRRPCNDWRDMQNIKNILAGPERQAIQIFPKESHLVDTSNQYHLWVLPEDMIIPIGWFTRATIDEELDSKDDLISQRSRS
tara:strand:+ start:1035 stop:1553 length:519 start_codon:yes stop_codon:yes gene_type:complete